MRRRHPRSTAPRAGLLAFRATPRVLPLYVIPAPPVLAVRLHFASAPAP
ncbi:hypothetical protein [Streptomyces javensis]|nr:hypothetical protein [Streptomyces javensis]